MAVDHTHTFISRDIYRRYMERHGSGLAAVITGPCVHSGCTLDGFDVTENYCSAHFVTDVLAELEDILHEANTHWAAACEAESNAKEIWRCSCGFVGSFVARESHFTHFNGSPEHQPPIANRPTVQGRIVGRRRVTETKVDLGKVEEIG